MIRAPLGEREYWQKRVTFDQKVVVENLELLKQPSKNPHYDPQFSLDLTERYLRLILRRYSRGDTISELGQHFAGLLDAWELSNKLADELNAELKPGQGWDHSHLGTAAQVSSQPRGHTDPRSWFFSLSDLNHYIWCFWLVGLALLLNIPDEQWQRLLELIGGEGEDTLLDRVIASRQPNWKIGNILLHPKPYSRLLKAIDAEKEAQPTLLKEFVENWYSEIDRKGDKQPYWYIYGDPEKHPLEMGSYFGRWCIEATVATKVFNLDDAFCFGHENYPGDLLRPDGETTHPQHIEETDTKQKNSLLCLLSQVFKGFKKSMGRGR